MHMKKGFYLSSKILLLGLISFFAQAQKFTTSNSTFVFYSEAAIEDIKAENKEVVSLFNVGTGDIAFSVRIDRFQFDKSLMQKHFNEKYMNSEKYPKATFSGKIEGYDKAAGGSQEVRAVGKLTIHAVTQTVTIPGTISVNDLKLNMKSKFLVKLADYKVDIPQLMWQNIAEQVEVTLDLTYKPQ